jgi:hypothetical protein
LRNASTRNPSSSSLLLISATDWAPAIPTMRPSFQPDLLLTEMWPSESSCGCDRHARKVCREVLRTRIMNSPDTYPLTTRTWIPRSRTSIV